MYGIDQSAMKIPAGYVAIHHSRARVRLLDCLPDSAIEQKTMRVAVTAFSSKGENYLVAISLATTVVIRRKKATRPAACLPLYRHGYRFHCPLMNAASSPPLESLGLLGFDFF
jgi:hypothetical protein